jgi:hypothetical protein
MKSLANHSRLAVTLRKRSMAAARLCPLTVRPVTSGNGLRGRTRSGP